ncbi:helix-turn-helix transcriptional regulator [Streptantibioticus silvisoli]|uniref:Helix-turn-helix transcriptional regulator n=1 Tax=Streptantibioticus silvisoli TaxID=2705255 RepID=A0ABT6W226_9ACTN|nr:helix-turn-helix transcriptional regulator [Streptantibioticus silvisoli]MDI5964798.1 helix-turn-helix transcriptional regulator [Streptantibioticus silvisoli]
MSNSNLLGEYLRARRERIHPGDVGLPSDDNRRVPGLRREEVALLAGISADYYLRLEQGRNRNPSPAVLDSLARALDLDDAANEHLRRVAASRPSSTRRRRRRTSTPATIRLLVESLNLPSFVEDDHFDVLAANRLAEALSPSFQAGQNRLLSMFLAPEERALFPDWEAVTADLVAAFRASVADVADDARTVELVGELSLRSQRFRELWSRHDVRPRVGTPPVRLTHPQLGEMQLMREKLVISGPSGQLLVIWHPHPGSDSAEKLALLASL